VDDIENLPFADAKLLTNHTQRLCFRKLTDLPNVVLAQLGASMAFASNHSVWL
jgi:hypothetical protein